MHSATWQPSRLHQPAHVDSPRPARPPIGVCPNPVAASHPTRGITLRNAPRRNPTCATVSPHRAPRTCGPARRRDGSSRQARAEPRASRIDRNRRESTGVERAGVARSSNRQLPIGVQIACEAPLVATRFLSIPADSRRLGSETISRTVPARSVCGISLRNAPKRNPTCATVSP